MTIKKTSLYINMFLIASIAVAIYTVVSLASAFGALEDVTRKKEILLLLGDELKQSSAELTSNVRLFAVTGDKKYQDAYNDVLKERSGKMPRFAERKLFPGESHELLKLLGRYGISDVELGYVREAENLSNKLVPLEEEAMRLTHSAIDGESSAVAQKDSPAREQAMALLYGGTYVRDLVPIVQSMNQFTTELDRRTSLQVEACRDDVTLYLRIMGCALAMMLLAALASILFTGKKIITPLIVTTQFAAEVAGGNLEKTIEAHENNEIGKLRNTLNTMVENLKENISSARKESEHATEQSQKAQQAMLHAESMSRESEKKSENILGTAQKLEKVVEVMVTSMKTLTEQIDTSGDGAAKQAARLAETASAMEEMNSTVLQVAQNARTASDVSNATRKKAEDGSQTVHKAVEGILEVQHHALKLKCDMAELDENARAINQIMNVISDIADQTNLLALNAAIEAARAGEAGRGFAVVADEVRKLAEKTMTSTAEVAKAISAIQSSASASMSQMDVSVKAIENSTTFVNASGMVLKEIMVLAENTASQVNDIAGAADQQSAASEEINRSISAIHGISTNTATSMQEADGVVQELSRQTEVVEGLIAQIKKADAVRKSI